VVITHLDQQLENVISNGFDRRTLNDLASVNIDSSPSCA
jgi:hypothetical protein